MFQEQKQNRALWAWRGRTSPNTKTERGNEEKLRELKNKKEIPRFSERFGSSRRKQTVVKVFKDWRDKTTLRRPSFYWASDRQPSTPETNIWPASRLNSDRRCSTTAGVTAFTAWRTPAASRSSAQTETAELLVFSRFFYGPRAIFNTNVKNKKTTGQKLPKAS